MLEIDDNELVIRVQNNDDTDALEELCNRHSGILIDKVYKYGNRLTQTQKNDIIDEKIYHVYNAAKKHDKEKSKFSTFLASQIIYLCLSKSSKNKKENLVNFEEVEYQEYDTSLSPDEIVCNSEYLTEILEFVNNLDDFNEKTVFFERYFHGNGFKLKTWEEVSKKVGFSVQGCINMHDRVVQKIKKELLNKYEIKY